MATRWKIGPRRNVRSRRGGARQAVESAAHRAWRLNLDFIKVLAHDDEILHFAAPRIDAALRGTGDLLAFAIAARLAHGDALSAAITAARDFVRAQIRAGVFFAGARTVR